MLHGSHEFRAVEHIYVEMVRPLPEISVQQIAQIFRSLLAVFAERGLVTVERHDKYITLRLTGNKRVDLDASPYLCALREGLDETKGGSSV